MPSSGFVDRWGDDVAHLTGTALVNTDPRRVEEVVASLQDAVGPYFAVAPAVDQDNFAKRVRDTIDVEVTVLGVFAVAAGLTGLLVIGQALARSAGSSTTDQQTLSAIGLDRRRQVLATAATLAPAIVLGALGAVPLAVGMSSLFPRGLARLADPDLGPVGGRAGGRPRRAPRAADRGDADALDELAHRSGWCPDRARPARRFAVVDRLAASVPAVPGLGARFALERGPPPGSGRRPGRDRGRRRARRRARRRRHHRTLPRPPPGRVPPVRRRLGPADGPLRGRRPAGCRCEQLGSDPDVDAVGTRSTLLADDGAVAVRSDRGRSVAEPTAYEWSKGSRPPVVSAGRPPGTGETAIGTELAGRLHAGIGDTVVVEGYDGDVSLRVTGWFVDPGTDELDTGLVVTRDTLEAMRARDCPSGDDSARCRLDVEGAAVAFRDGRRPRGRSGAAAEVPAGPGARADPFDRGQPGRDRLDAVAAGRLPRPHRRRGTGPLVDGQRASPPPRCRRRAGARASTGPGPVGRAMAGGGPGRARCGPRPRGRCPRRTGHLAAHRARRRRACLRRGAAVDGPARAAPRARARIGPGGSRGSAGRAACGPRWS